MLLDIALCIRTEVDLLYKLPRKRDDLAKEGSIIFLFELFGKSLVKELQNDFVGYH